MANLFDRADQALTVSELNRAVRIGIESLYPDGVWLKAELRDFKAHSSGHWYFSLRDDESDVNAVMWRGTAARMNFRPKDGDKLLLFGKPTLYTKRGSYQFAVQRMLPLGEGSRAARLRMLKEKLLKEGLFDKRHKKPLPEFPMRIGVATSPTGAAIRDIMNVLSRRAPYVEVILRPTTVQGDAAADDIVRAIEEMNRYGDVDLLIVGRGGGSEEDLWCFNEEKVVRAIYDSELPIISAVGHEIDTPLSDLVADKRAPTPSAAAEIAVKDKGELLAAIAGDTTAAASAVKRTIERKAMRLASITSRPTAETLERRINEHFQSVDNLVSKAALAARGALQTKESALAHIRAKLDVLSPQRVLERGFSIVTDSAGTIVRKAAELAPRDTVLIQFSEGKAQAVVDKTTLL